jgi:hypothetical protein
LTEPDQRGVGDRRLHRSIPSGKTGSSAFRIVEAFPFPFDFA